MWGALQKVVLHIFSPLTSSTPILALEGTSFFSEEYKKTIHRTVSFSSCQTGQVPRAGPSLLSP